VAMKQVIVTVAVALALAAQPAWAGAVQLPEPGVLPLLAIGAVGGLVLWARNRKNKKK
jgi:hypothetical protein